MIDDVENTSDVQTVSSENLDQFMTEKLNLATEEPTEPEEPAEQSEEIAAEVPEEPEEKTEEEKEPEKKPKNKLEQRMHELVSQKKEAEEKARKLEERLAKLEKTDKPVSVDRPLPENYEDVEAYTEALSDWKAEQKLSSQKAEQEAQQRVTAWQTRQREAEAEYPDYAEVVASCDVQVSPEVQSAIIESEVGPKVLYYLADNPEEAQRIAKLPVITALREIGKLEAKFETAEKKPVEKIPAQASKAPPPIAPIKSTASIDAKVDANGEFTGSYEEYKAARLAGKIK